MAYQFDNVKILIAEDNGPLMEIMKALLKVFGVGEVYTARDGGEAYELFCKHAPDIVLADWMMVPTDGLALCQSIRTLDSSPNKYVPFIIMTGFSERRRVFKARDAGITEFLVKPFTAQDLYKRIVQVVERPRQFVRSEDFFGPDRRRINNQEYTGPSRRAADVVKAQKIGEASHDLDELRRKAGLKKHDRITFNDDDEIDLV